MKRKSPPNNDNQKRGRGRPKTPSVTWTAQEGGGPWTVEEDRSILTCILRQGMESQWSQISRQMMIANTTTSGQRRTDTAIQNRWNFSLKKKVEDFVAREKKLQQQQQQQQRGGKRSSGGRNNNDNYDFNSFDNHRKF